MRIYRFPGGAVAIALISILAIACTSNWPQFRGPGNNMVAGVKDLPQQWGNEQNIKWEYPLSGNGWSGPVVWGDRIFITEVTLDENSYTPDTTLKPGQRPEYPQDGHYRWMVYCLDKNSGELLWEQMAREGQPRIPAHRDNTYASETPVTDGKMIYAYFGMHGLFCYDFEGNLIWKKDPGVYKAASDWGVSTSPVLYKNYLYMQIDNEEESFLLALDKKTGEEIWRVPREEKTNYSTPVIWKNNLGTELVTGGRTKARSYDPVTGKLIWELDLGGGRNIPSAVYNQDLIFLGNEKRRNKGGTLFAVKAGSRGDITPAEGDSTSNGVLWSVPNSGLSMPSPVLYKGFIYIVDRRPGAIHCYEASSGRIVYQKIRITDAGAFWSSPWAYDDKIWCLDERGTTHAIKAGEEFEILSRNSINDKFWSSAAITDNALILRGVEKLYYVQ